MFWGAAFAAMRQYTIPPIPRATAAQSGVHERGFRTHPVAGFQSKERIHHSVLLAEGVNQRRQFRVTWGMKLFGFDLPRMRPEMPRVME
jgi:hypothetical protein